ncbi:cation diffusion facilitator family transporter [Campylobacter sp. MIT 21-1685]|uniref:cation diffusion facilitator family transporter n=1 Tax=unclassified Campylobacter TaxID=2593542 RepID=UPI00224B20FD|nr:MULTISPECIES: cation diffusion facilitator family transporter [unclassified Campylobacter]MCX2682784.1 cation diffusion facilitator family transporter [Campylobacter sp. MIT 21-1684]MCX2751070.1 cation diffusion facilitator family transporter [Campylobacter sp. MIT 21-1682]MCX2807265.1 cation diffusion facilitator family transporter [Campylobacter sp. MIT 21-1685]
MKLEKKATIIASICALLLALVKFFIGLASGSVAILSSALDSMMDLVISLFNFLALRKSSQKPNASYNFGFSKIEALVGLLEGCFIAIISIFIFFQSIQKMYKYEEISDINSGMFVMFFSLVCTLILVLFLTYVAKKTNSLIVESDCLHYKTDLLTNCCTLLALIVIYFTQWHFIDAIFGIAASFYIAFSACSIVKKSLPFLMDKALESEKVKQIYTLIKNHKDVLSFHDLKTRKTPNINYLSVHLVFCPIISLFHAHKISDEIEQNIREKFCNEKWEFQIHLDPYDDQEVEREKQ